MSAVADVLNRAADLIDSGTVEWGQKPKPGARAICAGLAIGRAARGWPAGDVIRILAVSLGWSDDAPTRDDLGYVFDWNDTPGRTKAEVVAALRAAAERAS